MDNTQSKNISITQLKGGFIIESRVEPSEFVEVETKPKFEVVSSHVQMLEKVNDFFMTPPDIFRVEVIDIGNMEVDPNAPIIEEMEE